MNPNRVLVLHSSKSAVCNRVRNYVEPLLFRIVDIVLNQSMKKLEILSIKNRASELNTELFFVNYTLIQLL
jgi:hypothetical protein